MSFKKITGMLCCCLLLCFLWSQCKSTEETEQRTAEQTEETEQSADGEADEINAVYGSYMITQFFPTQYYQNMKYDVMPEQEADMLMGRIVVIEPEILITYDTERSLGTRGEREAFDGNY